jgi:predicted amidophosphoribosyltransferase
MAKRTLCPSCRRHLPPDAKVCLKCGADLRPSKLLWLLAVGSSLLAIYAAWDFVKF